MQVSKDTAKLSSLTHFLSNTVIWECLQMYKLLTYAIATHTVHARSSLAAPWSLYLHKQWGEGVFYGLFTLTPTSL